MQDVKLLRHGTVYDVYEAFSEDGQKFILKKLILNNSQGKNYFKSEKEILKLLRGKEGFVKLSDGGAPYELLLEYVPHDNYDDRLFLDLIKSREDLQNKLTERLAEFNSVGLNKKIGKDNFAVVSLKTSIKGFLKKKLSISQVCKIWAGILYSAFRHGSCSILTHNDISFGTDGNIFINNESEVSLIDFDRSATAVKGYWRDCLRFILATAPISEWDWQYDFCKTYLKYLQSYGIEFETERKELIYLSLRLCAMYFYYSGIPEINYKNNLTYLCDKNNCKQFYETFIRKVISSKG